MYARQKIKARLGVYAGFAELSSGKKYLAAIVIGPLDKRRLPKIEAHLLNFKGDLYGTYINIYLNRYLRPFEKFKSIGELKKQIVKDVNKVKRLK